MGNALFASCLPDAQADSQALREAALNVPPPSSSATSPTSTHGFSSSADENTNSGAGVFASTPTNNTTSSFSPSSPPSSGPSGINVRRAPEAAPAPRRSTPPAGHERAEAAAPAPAPALGGAVKPVAKPQPQQQPPKKVEEVDYFQDMEPTYVRPTIIQKGPAKPQAASRLAVETDPSWEDEAEGAWDEDDGLE